MKHARTSIDATPSKRIYRSIIADYDLRTGICELIDNAIDQWVKAGRSNSLRVRVAVEIDQQSIVVEDNGKFRNECLTVEWFRHRVEAQVGIERWRRHYNEERPHMSLGDQTPAEFKSQIKSQSGCLTEALI